MRKIKPESYNEGPMSLEKREFYPHLHLSLKHLPEAEKWKIGETYYVLLELKQTDLSVHSHKEETNGNAGFEITGLEVQKKPKKDYRELPDND